MRAGIAVAAVLMLVNHERARHHERPLRVDARLMHAARDCPEPRLFGCLRRHGYRGRGASENTAGFVTEGPREAVELWMESPPHRANILEPSWRLTGIAVSGQTYVQVFAVRPGR